MQLLYKLRSGRLGDQIPGVALVADHPPDVHRLKPGPLPGAQAAVVQHPGHRVAAGSFVGHFFKDFAHPGGFLRVDLQVLHRLVALVYPALIDSPVSIRHEPTGKMPAGHDLPNAVAGADRGFLAFSCRLPKADVVHQLIAVALDPLLALVDAPHLDAMLDKPFQHKGGLAFDAPQPVKHIDQQDVKAAVARLLPQLLDHIPLAGGHLGAGDSFLCLLHHHPPALLLGELAALDFLHGDVVVVDLPLGGHPVGQRRPRRVRRQMRLLGLEVSIVQPKLIGLGDLNGVPLFIPIYHFITLHRFFSGGWCARSEDGWGILCTLTIP